MAQLKIASANGQWRNSYGNHRNKRKPFNQQYNGGNKLMAEAK
jgi:hypothetical protein